MCVRNSKPESVSVSICLILVTSSPLPQAQHSISASDGLVRHDSLSCFPFLDLSYGVYSLPHLLGWTSFVVAHPFESTPGIRTTRVAGASFSGPSDEDFLRKIPYLPPLGPWALL